MTSASKILPLSPREIEAYGQARMRDIAFEAVQELWRRRSAEGMLQADLATALERDPAWVSRALRGPANWTFKTFGALIEALNGEIEIAVFGKEDSCPQRSNYQAYDDFISTRSVSVKVSPPSVRYDAKKAAVQVSTGL